MKEELKEIFDKHKDAWESENFAGWKTTEIMYCKIGWCIDVMEDLPEHLEILIQVRDFIEDLQKLEDDA